MLILLRFRVVFFFSSRRRHTRWTGDWSSDVCSSDLPGPVGVGTTYYQTRSIPTRSDERFQVTAFEPARRLEIHGQIGPFHARMGYLLEPTDSGTRLRNPVDLESSGPLALAAPLATS